MLIDFNNYLLLIILNDLQVIKKMKTALNFIFFNVKVILLTSIVVQNSQHLTCEIVIKIKVWVIHTTNGT